MTIKPFKLERYFAQYEFNVRVLMSSSDCESLSQTELLQLAAPESLTLWGDLRLGYTESQGHPLLRAEIAALYEHIPAENILTAAPEEAIFIAMHTLLTPGDHVIAVMPAYQSLYEIARSLGCTVTPWMLELDETGWKLDINRLEASLTVRTRLLVLNFPHNPTGHNLTRAELDAIIRFARKHNLVIFSDEMYRLLEMDPAARLPAMCDLYEKAVTLSGLSKSFALPGLRIGWLAAQDHGWMEGWLTFKDYTTICSSAPSEILGVIALQNKETIVERNRQIVRANIAAADGFFKTHAERFTWITPKAGSIAFPRCDGSIPVEQFCTDLLEYGVMLVPGSLFDYPGSHFRLGLGRKNFSEGLELVERYLGK